MARHFTMLVLFGSLASCSSGALEFPPPCDAAVGRAASFDLAGATHKFVFDKITAPMQRIDFAIDLNGDGHVDNQLGNIIGAGSANGIDEQTVLDSALSSGALIDLLTLGSSDAQLQNDVQPEVGLNLGTPTHPDYSGAGKFTIDDSFPTAAFTGSLASGVYESENPVTTKSPVHFILRLPLVGTPPVDLPIQGAHLQLQVKMVDRATVLTGQLHGSIKNADVLATLAPAVAQSIVARTKIDPTSEETISLVSELDGGGCTNPDGSMAIAHDGIIDLCEVTNSIIWTILFAPDIQVYDACGNYAPNPKNLVRDSLSLGIGFTAVPANF